MHGRSGGGRLDGPLPHVGIEDIDDLEIGRDLQGDLVQFRAADRVDQGRAGPRDAFLDPDLLFRLHAGQGREALAPSDLGVQSIRTSGAAPTKARMTVSSAFSRLGRVFRFGFLLARPRRGSSRRRDFRGGNQRMQIHLHAGLRNTDLPAAHRGLRGLERHVFRPGERVIARAYSSRSSICSDCLPFFSISKR